MQPTRTNAQLSPQRSKRLPLPHTWPLTHPNPSRCSSGPELAPVVRPGTDMLNPQFQCSRLWEKNCGFGLGFLIKHIRLRCLSLPDVAAFRREILSTSEHFSQIHSSCLRARNSILVCQSVAFNPNSTLYLLLTPIERSATYYLQCALL